MFSTQLTQLVALVLSTRALRALGTGVKLMEEPSFSCGGGAWQAPPPAAELCPSHHHEGSQSDREKEPESLGGTEEKMPKHKEG